MESDDDMAMLWSRTPTAGVHKSMPANVHDVVVIVDDDDLPPILRSARMRPRIFYQTRITRGGVYKNRFELSINDRRRLRSFNYTKIMAKRKSGKSFFSMGNANIKKEVGDDTSEKVVVKEEMINQENSDDTSEGMIVEEAEDTVSERSGASIEVKTEMTEGCIASGRREIPLAFIKYRSRNIEDEDEDSVEQPLSENRMTDKRLKSRVERREKESRVMKRMESGVKKRIESGVKKRTEKISLSRDVRRMETRTDLREERKKRRDGEEKKKREEEERKKRRREEEKRRIRRVGDTSREIRREEEERERERKRRAARKTIEKIKDRIKRKSQLDKSEHCHVKVINDKKRSGDDSETVNEIGSDVLVVDTRPRVRRSVHEAAFDSDTITKIALSAHDNTQESHFTIASFSKGERRIALKRVDNVNLPIAWKPLGAVYDRVLHMWIYTDTLGGRVVLASYEGHKKAILKGFNLPSAIAIINVGSHFAILDHDGIILIDLMTNTRKTIADRFNGRYRGLGTTEDGNLVTIRWTKNCVDSHIAVFSLSEQNKIICSTAYSSSPCRPSFLCTYGAMIYVTDLELNVLSAYMYRQEVKKISYVTNLLDSKKRTSKMKTKFMAGLVVDSAHQLLVADATGHRLHYASPDGSLIQTVPFLNSDSTPSDCPYISGMAIAPTGRIMVCCRHQSEVRLYDMVPLSTDEDLLAKKMKAVLIPERLY